MSSSYSQISIFSPSSTKTVFDYPILETIFATPASYRNCMSRLRSTTSLKHNAFPKRVRLKMKLERVLLKSLLKEFKSIKTHNSSNRTVLVNDSLYFFIRRILMHSMISFQFHLDVGFLAIVMASIL